MASLDSLDDVLRELREVREILAILEPHREPGEQLIATVRRLAKRPGPVAVERPMQPVSQLAGYKTPAQIVAACPGLTAGGLKWMLFHRETNGLAAHVVAVGRKLMIHEPGFLEWLKAHRGKAA